MVMNEGQNTLENACKEFEADLVLYYYGDDSEADHLRVERHCRECARCRGFLDDLRNLLPRMAIPQELPATFWDRYYNEMVEKLALQRERNSWWKNLFKPVRTWALPAFGTAVVAALALFLVFGRAEHKAVPPQIPQEILTDANSLEFFNSMDLLESLGTLEKKNDNGSRSDLGVVRHT